MNFDQLAKAMKTKKGFDPMPPDQYLTYRDRRYPPAVRLWAWIISKTMRLGHRSPFCVDGQGRDLSLSDAYRELGLDRSLARRALKELESEGRVQLQGYRIHLTADFQLKSVEAVIEDLKLERAICTNHIPPYVLLKLKKLPGYVQKRFWAWREDFEDRSRFAHRELLALQRIIEQREEDTVFAEFGLARKHQKKRRPDPSPLLPLLEPVLAGIVQSRNGGSADPENQDRTRPASLLTSELNTQRREKARAATANAGDSAAPLSSLLNQQRKQKLSPRDQIALAVIKEDLDA